MHYSDIFNQVPVLASEDNQLFSITGNPSIRINRRNNNRTNVFPKGCMGDGRATHYDKQQQEQHQQQIQHQQQGQHYQQQQTLQDLPEHNEEEDQDEAEEPETSREYNDAGRIQHEEDVDCTPPTNVYNSNAVINNEEKLNHHVAPIVHGRVPMYQFEGSNMSRNPLTGYGMEEDIKKQGKRVNKKRDPKWHW